MSHLGKEGAADTLTARRPSVAVPLDKDALNLMKSLPERPPGSEDSFGCLSAPAPCAWPRVRLRLLRGLRPAVPRDQEAPFPWGSRSPACPTTSFSTHLPGSAPPAWPVSLLPQAALHPGWTLDHPGVTSD